MITEELLSTVLPQMSKGHRNMLLMPWWVGRYVMLWAGHERGLANMLSRLREVAYEPLRDYLLDQHVSAYEIEIRKEIERFGQGNSIARALEDMLPIHIELRTLRHDLVHGFWAGLGPDEDYQLKRKARRKADTQRSLSVAEVATECDRLDKIGLMVVNISRAFEKRPIL